MDYARVLPAVVILTVGCTRLSPPPVVEPPRPPTADARRVAQLDSLIDIVATRSALAGMLIRFGASSSESRDGVTDLLVSLEDLARAQGILSSELAGLDTTGLNVLDRLAAASARMTFLFRTLETAALPLRPVPPQP